MVIRLAAGLDRRRFQGLICCLDQPGPFSPQATREGVEVVSLGKRGPVDLRVVGRLARLLRRREIDVVHTHLWGADLWGRLAARVAGVRHVVATAHNLDTWKRRYHFAIDRLLVPWTTHLVAVSREVKDFYEGHGVGNGRWRVIYNGVVENPAVSLSRGSAFEALGIGGDEPVVGLIGRLVPAKAPHVFLKAVARAAPRIPSLRALLVGDGPLRAELEEQVRTLGLESRVVLTGLRQDVPELLAGMNAVVFSSEREGLSMAMLEAMAAGVPVVATRVGGTPELIETGVSGLLVSPGDHEGIADRLVEVLEDRALAARLSQAARVRVSSQFSLRRMVAEHEQLYVTGPETGGSLLAT